MAWRRRLIIRSHLLLLAYGADFLAHVTWLLFLVNNLERLLFGWCHLVQGLLLRSLFWWSLLWWCLDANVGLNIDIILGRLIGLLIDSWLFKSLVSRNCITLHTVHVSFLSLLARAFAQSFFGLLISIASSARWFPLIDFGLHLNHLSCLFVYRPLLSLYRFNFGHFWLFNFFGLWRSWWFRRLYGHCFLLFFLINFFDKWLLFYGRIYNLFLWLL